MKYVLIIVYVGYKLGGITAVDFEDMEACERGKAQISAHFSGGWGNDAARLKEQNMLCVPKGAQ